MHRVVRLAWCVVWCVAWCVACGASHGGALHSAGGEAADKLAKMLRPMRPMRPMHPLRSLHPAPPAPPILYPLPPLHLSAICIPADHAEQSAVTLHTTLQNGIFSAHPPSTRANVRGRLPQEATDIALAALYPLHALGPYYTPPHRNTPSGLQQHTLAPRLCKVGAFMAALATEASTWQRWKNSLVRWLKAPSGIGVGKGGQCSPLPSHHGIADGAPQPATSASRGL